MVPLSACTRSDQTDHWNHLGAQEVLEESANSVGRHARHDVVVENYARAQPLAQLGHAHVRAGGGGETNDAYIRDGL